jgi:hypothetical protein
VWRPAAHLNPVCAHSSPQTAILITAKPPPTLCSAPLGRDALYVALAGAGGGADTGADAAAAWERAAARAGRSSGGSSGGGPSLEEARRAWQGALALAGSSGGPALDELLRVGGGGGEALGAALAQLQGSLQRAATDCASSSGGGSSSSGGKGSGSLQERLWQRLTAAVQRGGGGGSSSSGGDSGSSGDAAAEGQTALDAAALQERHRLELQAAAAVAPPYPGARRLLRWEQRIVFHAASAIAQHPRERAAVLRVHAGELAEEAGLSPTALQYMLAVAGDVARGGRCAAGPRGHVATGAALRPVCGASMSHAGKPHLTPHPPPTTPPPPKGMTPQRATSA